MRCIGVGCIRHCLHKRHSHCLPLGTARSARAFYASAACGTFGIGNALSQAMCDSALDLLPVALRAAHGLRRTQQAQGGTGCHGNLVAASGTLLFARLHHGLKAITVAHIQAFLLQCLCAFGARCICQGLHKGQSRLTRPSVAGWARALHARAACLSLRVQQTLAQAVLHNALDLLSVALCTRVGLSLAEQAQSRTGCHGNLIVAGGTLLLACLHHCLKAIPAQHVSTFHRHR